MNKKMSFLALAVFLPYAAFAQCGSEEQLTQKWESLKEQCAQISNMVPCAFGWYEADRFESALRVSKDRAIVELAKSVKSFVSYDSADSTWIDNGVSQELITIVGKIKLENFLLSNSQQIGQECGKYTDNGKTKYRAVTLVALDKALYAEALGEVEKAEPSPSEMPSSSSGVAPPPPPESEADKVNALKQNTVPNVDLPKKDKFTRIATKTALFLLNIGKKFLGIPL